MHAIAQHHHTSRAARIHARARARAMPEIVQAPPEWLTDTALSALTPLLTTYARTSSFEGALTTIDDFALRRRADGAQIFRHFDTRLFGVIRPKRAKINIVGTTPSQLMRDVISSYCAEASGGAKRAQIASGGRMVHLAAVRLSGGRVVRHVCYDSTGRDPVTGHSISATKIILHPNGPPPLVLGPELRVWD